MPPPSPSFPRSSRSNIRTRRITFYSALAIGITFFLVRTATEHEGLSSLSVQTEQSPKSLSQATKTYTSQSTAEATCKELFLSGVQPMQTNNKPPPAWLDNHCDQLYCTNYDEHAQDSIQAERMCQWSLLAIDTLLDSLHLNQVCDQEHVKEFLPDEYWARYQLSDWVTGQKFNKLRHAGALGNVTEKEQWKQFKSAYNGSLADKYQEETSKRQQTPSLESVPVLYNAVKQMISTMPADQLPEPNTLVIHLRLGDVIDGTHDEVRDLLFEQKYYYRNESEQSGPFKKFHTPFEAQRNATALAESWNQYVRPLSYYAEILNNDKYQKYTSIVLMGSAHLGQVANKEEMQPVKSCHYTKALHAYISRAMPHAKVTMRLGQDPDSDVAFSTQADGYLKAGGGFSHLIEKLQSMRVEDERAVHFLLVQLAY